MKAHESGRIPADPYGADATGPAVPPVLSGVSGPEGLDGPEGPEGPGRNGARCDLTATGPTPGPPPPCGMQKVLCRLRWDTSAPNDVGVASPTRALRFAPSM